MSREEKIKQLQSLQEGKIKPLDLINHGFWLWHLKDSVYHCEVLNFGHLKLNHDEWMRFCEGGGHHIVTRKTYATLTPPESIVEPVISSPLPVREVEAVTPKREVQPQIKPETQPEIIEPEISEYKIKIRGDRVEDIRWEDVPFDKWINRLGR